MANNNDNSGAILILAFFGAVATILFLAVAAIAGFITVVLTILSLCAWRHEIRLGSHIITPAEARSFIGRGIVGTVMAPLFVLFCEFLFEVRFDWGQYGFYVLFSGYILGSTGIEFLRAKAQEEEELRARMYPSARTVSPPPQQQPQRGLPAPPAEPFRYASWDDDEGR